jgi:hypothetical protein
MSETVTTCEGEWREAICPHPYGWSQHILVCSGCSDVWAPDFQGAMDKLLAQYRRGIITVDEYLGQIALLEAEVVQVRLARAHMPRPVREEVTQ